MTIEGEIECASARRMPDSADIASDGGDNPCDYDVDSSSAHHRKALQ